MVETQNISPFRQLFDLMGEGFRVIEFLDGPHEPASDYIHVAAYAWNAVLNHGHVERGMGADKVVRDARPRRVGGPDPAGLAPTPALIPRAGTNHR